MDSQQIRKPNLIAISGYIGSGKDTVGRMIQAHTILAKDPDFFTIPKDNSIDLQTNRFPMHNVISILQENNLMLSLEHSSGWEIKKFAEKLKQFVAILLGIPRASLELEEVKNRVLGEEWDKLVPITTPNGGWGLGTRSKPFENKKMTIRDLLQTLGTQAMRDVVHPDIHVNGLFADYKSIGYKVPNSKEEAIYSTYNSAMEADPTFENIYPNWLITDVRFENEAWAINDRGGIIIRVERPSLVSDKPKHESETSLDSWDFDIVIENDDSFEDLFSTVGKICKDLNLI